VSDYLRIRTSLDLSEHSDYHAPVSSLEMEYNTTASKTDTQMCDAELAGTTVELGNFTTVTAVVVTNLDDTNFVTVEHTYDGATATVYLPPDGHTVIYNPTVAADITLTADTAICSCRVWIVGH
jgi:hypothetical protein